MNKSLKSLLAGLPVQINNNLSNDDVLINNIAIDSRAVKAGDLFLAYPGSSNDGRKYIDQAINNGAKVIIYDPEGYTLPYSQFNNQKQNGSNEIVYIAVKDLNKYISLLAGNFYEHPSHRQNIYAVTGTNGKTSCAYIISQLLTQLDEPAGFIGTIGYGRVVGNKLVKSDTTTPSPVEIQRILADFKIQKIFDVAIEASSHALDQYRAEDVAISNAIFTNLSQDHLDYHQTLEQYYLAKKRLFFFKSLKNIVINIDDPYGARLFDELSASRNELVERQQSSNKTSAEQVHPNIILYSLNPALIHSLSGAIIIFDPVNNRLLFKGCEKFGLTTSSVDFTPPDNLVGQFNAYNLLAVMAAILANGHSLQKIIDCIPKIKPPPGRMEIFINHKKNVRLIVDYAHTPDALQKSLLAIKRHFGKNLNNLWCVFGCGGDRDRTKRPLMGQAAAQDAHKIILTDDNPRTEDANAIIKEIERGFTELQKDKIFAIINDRRKAIVTALENSMPNDVILIAGKGHEDYQIYGSQKTNYDERAFVEELSK